MHRKMSPGGQILLAIMIGAVYLATTIISPNPEIKSLILIISVFSFACFYNYLSKAPVKIGIFTISIFSAIILIAIFNMTLGIGITTWHFILAIFTIYGLRTIWLSRKAE